MTGSDAGAAPLSSSPQPSRPPKGPTAPLPSLEPRQSLLSKDSSLEDFGLWALGVREDVIPTGEAWQTPVPGRPVGRGQEGSVLPAPGPWPGWTWTDEPCHMLARHLKANKLAHATEASALGLPPPLPPQLMPVALHLWQSLRALSSLL